MFAAHCSCYLSIIINCYLKIINVILKWKCSTSQWETNTNATEKHKNLNLKFFNLYGVLMNDFYTYAFFWKDFQLLVTQH